MILEYEGSSGKKALRVYAIVKIVDIAIARTARLRVYDCIHNCYIIYIRPDVTKSSKVNRSRASAHRWLRIHVVYLYSIQNNTRPTGSSLSL